MARQRPDVFNRFNGKIVFKPSGFDAELSDAGQAAEKVDLELILMVDGSGSVDYEEFTLQRTGYAKALSHPRVINAIRAGPLGAIALSYVEWSGPFLHVPIVDWRVIRGKKTWMPSSHC